MAKSKGFDVWLTATNRVYRAVPYDVVADWLQQGRIVGDDRVRTEGGEWALVSDSPAWTAYLPRPALEPAAEDRAEALEPVDFEIPSSRRPLDDDDDVDMIPLIDISLVLLIFFMMTATVAVSGADIPTPQTYHGVELTRSDSATLWVGIDRADGGRPVYSVGQGDRPPDDADRSLTQEQVLSWIDDRIRAINSSYGVVVRVAAHKQIPFGTVQALTAELEKRRGAGRIMEIKAEMNQSRHDVERRHAGSPRSVAGLTTDEVVTGLTDGRWEPTDEVRGEDETLWRPLEDHPQFAEIAFDLNPAPLAPPGRERLDMTR